MGGHSDGLVTMIRATIVSLCDLCVIIVGIKNVCTVDVSFHLDLPSWDFMGVNHLLTV